MISVIICSTTPFLDDKLLHNIEKTIGGDFEIVHIDNSKNEYNISEAYNLGIKWSIGKYLCFLHQDVVLHTQNWGAICQKIFQSADNIGLIGVAGASVKGSQIGGWWDCDPKYKIINIIQHYNSEVSRVRMGFNEKNEQDVVIIDGVFMVTKKCLNISFDENLQGFHCYDLYLSLTMIQKSKRIVATKQITLEHFSLGNVNDSWYATSKVVHRKFKDILPSYITNYNNQDKLIALKRSIKYAQRFNDKSLLYKNWLLLFFTQPFSKFHDELLKSQIKKIKL